MKNESSIVLVTGGKGFVGSRLVKRLLDTGNKVVVVDNMSYGNEDNMIIDDEESFWEKMPAIYDGKHRIKDKVLFDEVNKCTCMDMTKVETVYGWKAKHSFEDGIKLTVEKMVEQLRKVQR